MFDIGFSELVVIGVVALVVIGPERLPRVARTVGHLLGRVQRYVNDVKADIDREMQLEELKNLQAQVRESARSLENAVRREMDAAQTTLARIGTPHADPDELPAHATGQPPPPSVENPAPTGAPEIRGATRAPIDQTRPAA
jgi:sec-independent protein translocase protein TatB